MADEEDTAWHLRIGGNGQQAGSTARQDADGSGACSSSGKEEPALPVGSDGAVDQNLCQWLLARWQSGRSPGVLVAVLESVGLTWEEAVRVGQVATSASKESMRDDGLLRHQFMLVSTISIA